MLQTTYWFRAGKTTRDVGESRLDRVDNTVVSLPVRYASAGCRLGGKQLGGSLWIIKPVQVGTALLGPGTGGLFSAPRITLPGRYFDERFGV
jgi:hypothetical protein